MKSLSRKPDLAAEAEDALRAAILSGELGPGAPMAQADLAERLGVSRQPVMQALQALRREGLVVERGKRGLEVAPLAPDRLRGVYDVRAALEGLAARRAAEAGDPDARLEPVLARGRAAIENGAAAALVAVDVEFHTMIYALAGNAVLAETAAPLWPHMRRAMAATLRHRKDVVSGLASVWNEHDAIAAAILNRDPAHAEALAADHCRTSGRATADQIEQALAAESD